MSNTGTWAEVNLGALEHNFKTLKSLLKPGVKALGVCKANAYGHGMVEVAKRLEKCGADMLAVARVQEGVEIRENGIKTPILCLGEAEPDLAEIILKNDIIQAVGDLETGKKLAENAVKCGGKIKVHLKLDTGMSRIGFFWPDDENLGENLEDENLKVKTADKMAELASLKGLEITGMFSHFADADSNKEYTLRQVKKFSEARELLLKRGVNLEICHMAASSGTVFYPESHFDMARFGIVLYGYVLGDKGNEGSDLGLKPVMTVKSRIMAIRKLPKGTKIGYGCTAELERNSVIAVLATGYADGLPRILSNNYFVKINNKICKITGRICMDMCMADITDLVNNGEVVNVGDEAVIYDEELIVIAAKNAHTVIHEILCLSSAPRVEHVFLN